MSEETENYDEAPEVDFMSAKGDTSEAVIADATENENAPDGGADSGNKEVLHSGEVESPTQSAVPNSLLDDKDLFNPVSPEILESDNSFKHLKHQQSLMPEPRPGMAQCWVRILVGDDLDADAIHDMKRNYWTFRDRKTLTPEEQSRFHGTLKGGSPDIIMLRDVALCERAVEIQREADKIADEDNKRARNIELKEQTLSTKMNETVVNGIRPDAAPNEYN